MLKYKSKAPSTKFYVCTAVTSRALTEEIVGFSGEWCVIKGSGCTLNTTVLAFLEKKS